MDTPKKKPVIPVFSNLPVWNTRDPKSREGFQEVWYLKFNDPLTQKALWIRFTLLSSANGFRRVAETWAIAFERKESGEISKLAMKQTHDIKKFAAQGGSFEHGIKIGDCELTQNVTRGSIQSKGRIIKWDLKIEHGQSARFNLVPESLARTGLVKNRAATIAGDLRFTGTTEIDGEKTEWKAAPGMQGHLSGPKSAHSWVWGHCNAFVNETGQPVSFIFEGLNAKAKIAGGVTAPKLSSFYFRYQNQDYYFNSLWDAIRCRSQNTLTDWEFQAERGDISFRGHAKAEHRDFAGITYEDTDGSLLYCANSKLSNMTVLIYRRGKLETTLKANSTAAFEVVSRNKNPYVPLIL